MDTIVITNPKRWRDWPGSLTSFIQPSPLPNCTGAVAPPPTRTRPVLPASHRAPPPPLPPPFPLYPTPTPQYAAFEDEVGVYLITEYASRGDVFGELDRRGGTMSEGDAVRQVREG